MPDYYAVLDLPSNADPSEIKAAKKLHVRLHHPDKNRKNRLQAYERSLLINEACEVLQDNKKRDQYDHGRAMARRSEVISRPRSSRCFERTCYLTPRIKSSNRSVLSEAVVHNTYQPGESFDFVLPTVLLVLLIALLRDVRKLWSRRKTIMRNSPELKGSLCDRRRRSSSRSSKARSHDDNSIDRRRVSSIASAREMSRGSRSYCSSRD